MKAAREILVVTEDCRLHSGVSTNRVSYRSTTQSSQIFKNGQQQLRALITTIWLFKRLLLLLSVLLFNRTVLGTTSSIRMLLLALLSLARNLLGRLMKRE